jgi:hypothetical protein
MNILLTCPEVTEDQIKNAIARGGKFAKYAPNFTGRTTPTQSVNDMLTVINKASLVDGYGGCFISHLGTKRWL